MTAKQHNKLIKSYKKYRSLNRVRLSRLRSAASFLMIPTAESPQWDTPRGVPKPLPAGRQTVPKATLFKFAIHLLTEVRSFLVLG